MMALEVTRDSLGYLKQQPFLKQQVTQMKNTIDDFGIL